MKLYKILFFVVSMIMVQSALSLPTKGRLSETQWKKIWEHINADDKLVQESRARSSNPTSDVENVPTLPEDNKQWIALLQNVFDGRKPSTQADNPTTTTSTISTTSTPVVTSSTRIDVQDLLGFLDHNKIHLSDVQWVLLLKYILSDKDEKVMTTVKPNSLPVFTSAASDTDTMETENKANEDHWAKRVEKLLNDPVHEGDKAHIDRDKSPAATTTTTTASSTRTTSAVKSPKSIGMQGLLNFLEQNKIILDEDQSLSLLKFIFADKADEKTTEKPKLLATSTTTASNTDKVKTINKADENDWVKRLDDLLNDPIPQGNSGHIIAHHNNVAKSTTASPKQEDGDISDHEWQTVLEEYLDINLKKKNNNMDLSTPPTSSIKKEQETSTAKPTSTATIGDSKKDKLKTENKVDEEEWIKRLDQLLSDPIHQSDITHKTASPTNAPSTTTAQKQQNGDFSEKYPKKKNNNVELSTPTTTTMRKTTKPSGDDISDEQWQHLLKQYLNVDLTQEGNKYESSSTETTTTKTPEISGEQWQNLLEQHLNGKAKEDGHSKPLTTPKAATAKDFKISDEQWQSLLQAYLNGQKLALEKTFTTPTTKTGQQSKSDDTNDISDKIWGLALQQVLDEKQLTVDTKTGAKATPQPMIATSTAVPNNNNVDLPDELWEKMLEDVLNDDILSPHTTKKPSDVFPLDKVLDSKLPSTTSTPEKLKSSTDTLSEQHSSSQHVPKSTTIKRTTPSTRKTVDIQEGVELNNGFSTESPSDEKWEKLMESVLDEDDQQTNSNERTSPQQTEGTTNAEQEVNSPQAFKADNLPKAEKVVNIETKTNDMYTMLAIGTGTGVLLVIVIIVVAGIVCRKKGVLCWAKKDSHSTILNSDLNRWDPQMLRPTKENMNQFMYSIPMPMQEIKPQY